MGNENNIEISAEETVETPITSEMSEEEILEESPAEVAPVIDNI